MTEIKSLSSCIVELYKHLDFFLSCSTPACLYNSTMPSRLRYLFVVVSPTDENFPVTIPNFGQAAGRWGLQSFRSHWAITS